jgi:ribosomal protein L29
MPVTAKLSRKFYEALGDEVSNELVDWFNAVDLTYRTELREVNDLNWARFKAELEGGMAGLRAEFKEEMAGLRVEFKEEMAGLRVEVKQEIAGLRTEFKQEIAGLRTEFKDEMAGLRTEVAMGNADLRSELAKGLAEQRMATEALGAKLRTDMAVQKADLVKLMFLFWLGTVAAGVATRLL